MAIVDTTSTNTAVQNLFNTKVKDSTANVSTIADAATGNQAMGKDAFLQLLVTQLKNQDPLSPQDNGAFVAQLAQFSSLEGINNLNDTVKAISTNATSSQALQASSLVGRSVITQTDKTVVDTSKSMTGTVTVPSAVGNVSVKITDKDGNTVRTVDMGEQSAGNASFIWDGKNSSGEVAPAGTYTFTATTKNDAGDSVALATSLPATVVSVTLSQTGGEMLLNLAGGTSIKQSQIQTIGT